VEEGDHQRQDPANRRLTLPAAMPSQERPGGRFVPPDAKKEGPTGHCRIVATIEETVATGSPQMTKQKSRLAKSAGNKDPVG
jgi:hypothetical protein